MAQINRGRLFAGLAIVTGLAFAIMGIAGAPGPAFAIVAVVVGALYALLAVFWPKDQA